MVQIEDSLVNNGYNVVNEVIMLNYTHKIYNMVCLPMSHSLMNTTI